MALPRPNASLLFAWFLPRPDSRELSRHCATGRDATHYSSFGRPHPQSILAPPRKYWAGRAPREPPAPPDYIQADATPLCPGTPLVVSRLPAWEHGVGVLIVSCYCLDRVLIAYCDDGIWMMQLSCCSVPVGPRLPAIPAARIHITG